MSYGAGVALQAAVYQQLRTNEALADLVSGAHGGVPRCLWRWNECTGGAPGVPGRGWNG